MSHGPLSGSPRGDNQLAALLRRIERLEAQLAASPAARTHPAPRQVIIAQAGSCTAGMAVRVVAGACTVDPANWYGLAGPDCGVIESVRAGVATVVTAGTYAGPVVNGASCAEINGQVLAGSTWAERAWLGRRAVVTPPGDGIADTPRWVVPWDAPSPRIDGDWDLEPSTSPRAGQEWRYYDETGLTSPASHTAVDIPAGVRIGIWVDSVTDPVAGATYQVVLYSGSVRLSDPPPGTAVLSRETLYPTGIAHAVGGFPSASIPAIALAHRTDFVGGGAEVVILHDSDGRGRHLHGRVIDPTAPTANGQVYVWSVAQTKWILGTAASDWSDITGIPSTFPPSAHGHAISDVSGLSSALAGKSDVGHGHALAGDVTGTLAASTVARFNGRPLDDSGLVTSGTNGVQMLYFSNLSDSYVPSAQIGAGANGARGALLTAYSTGPTTFEIGEVGPVGAARTGYLLGIDTDLSAAGTKPKWLQDIVLGDATSPGSVKVLVNGASGDYWIVDTSGRLRFFDVSVSTGTPVIDIDPVATTPTGGWNTTNKQLKLRQEDVCDGGTVKSRMYLSTDVF